MIAFAFDALTARESSGNYIARLVEQKARNDADIHTFDPPKTGGLTYWDKAQKEFRYVVYYEQYKKRLARNKRKEYIEK